MKTPRGGPRAPGRRPGRRGPALKRGQRLGCVPASSSGAAGGRGRSPSCCRGRRCRHVEGEAAAMLGRASPEAAPTTMGSDTCWRHELSLTVPEDGPPGNAVRGLRGRLRAGAKGRKAPPSRCQSPTVARSPPPPVPWNLTVGASDLLVHRVPSGA